MHHIISSTNTAVLLWMIWFGNKDSVVFASVSNGLMLKMIAKIRICRFWSKNNNDCFVLC